MKKFELTTNTKIKYGRTFIQIKASISFETIFGKVKKGDLGGWVEKEQSLGDDCWIWPNAEAFSDAVIRGGVIWGGEIRGGEIWGGVIRGGEIWGGVIRGGVIWGGVIWGGVIRGGVIWGGEIRGGEIWGGEIRGGEIRGGEIWGGEIRGGEIWGGVIRGGVIRGGEIRGGEIRGGEIRGGEIRGGEIWGGEIWGGEIWGGEIRGGEIKKTTDYIAFCSIGNDGGVLTAYIKEKDIEVTRGCFRGTLKEFENAVIKKHNTNLYSKEYAFAIELIKLRFSAELKKIKESK